MSKRSELTKDYIKELASDIMLNLTDSEIESIIKTENFLRDSFNKVTSIDTENVEAMFYPIECEHDYMRDDSEHYENNQSDLLKNAPTTEGDFVTIVKVVK